MQLVQILELIPMAGKSKEYNLDLIMILMRNGYPIKQDTHVTVC